MKRIRRKTSVSKIKLAMEVVEDLRKLAFSVEELAHELMASNIEPENEKDEPKAKEPITLEEVRAALAAKSQSGKQPEVKALITSFGAKKLTEIDPSMYEDLMVKAGEI